MLTIPEQIGFLVLVLISLLLSIKSFSIMIKVINRGQKKFYFDGLISRITEAVSVLFTQKTVLKSRPLVSFIHSLIAWSFILYLAVNLGDSVNAFFSDFIFLGQGILGNLYRLFTDIFSALAVLAMSFFLIRRFVFQVQSQKFHENILISSETKLGLRKDSMIVGLFIIFHIGFRFLCESITLCMEGNDPWQPLASELSVVWSSIGVEKLFILQHLFWWIAIGLILAFIPYFPLSKHAHLFMGPINYLTRPRRNAYGTLEIIDFENDKTEQYGVSKIEHLEKSQILDAYACIMCNRCQDVCPAYLTGKELSPSALEINKRYYLNQNRKALAGGEDSKEFMLDFGLSPSALWACTSCAACVEICPVGNEPMYDILTIRRDRVLMESNFPKQLQGAFNGMERNQNPWNMNEDRLKWMEADPSLVVKTVEQNPDFEILYWIGCAGAFDQRAQKITRAFTKILNKAEINFAVLGNMEGCTGDSARRAGNEYLFSMMALHNIETLNTYKVKKIVVTCPHCLHTLKNEYPQLGGRYEVIHYSQYIETLFNTGKIKLASKNRVNKIKITYHDPCYLGRHNRIFEAPRNILKSLGRPFAEPERNKTNSFCCGAGGAQMWKEEEKGSESVRHHRLKEIQKTSSDLLCTTCPFCLTMLTDACNELHAAIEIQDLAQILVEYLE